MPVRSTLDESGGWQNHVAPPTGHVDHMVYDTGLIARFITRRFGLPGLPGLKQREEAMIAGDGPAPGDLTAALQFNAS